MMEAFPPSLCLTQLGSSVSIAPCLLILSLASSFGPYFVIRLSHYSLGCPHHPEFLRSGGLTAANNPCLSEIGSGTSSETRLSCGVPIALLMQLWVTVDIANLDSLKSYDIWMKNIQIFWNDVNSSALVNILQILFLPGLSIVGFLWIKQKLYV